MTRAAWMMVACSLGLSPLAQAQEYPIPANFMKSQRVAQAPAPISPLPPVAAQPAARQPAPEHAPIVAGSLSEVAPTPEMWFYEREREEYADPRNAVRAAAEFRAEQRRKRLAAMQWFGYSNARPSHAVTPTTTANSPQWGSNTATPYIWSGTSRPTIVHLPGNPTWR